MIINNISKFYKDENAEDNLEKNIQSSKAIVNIPKLRWDEDGENVTGIDMVLPEVLNDCISGNTSCSDKDYFDFERKMSNKNRKKKVNKAKHSKKKKRKNKSNHQTEEPPDPLMDIDLVKKGPNIIYCKLCRITVSNKPGHDSRHFKGNLHSTERQFFLTRNKITASHFYENYGYLHCGWCNIHFYEGFIHEHVLSESHTTHIQELIEYENKRLEYYTREAEHQKIVCVICNDGKKIFKGLGIINLHFTNMHHLNNHKALLFNNEIELFDNSLFCNVCNIAIEDFHDIIHISDESHKRNLNEFNNVLNSDDTDEEHEVYYYNKNLQREQNIE
ncbi:uncharacterized protein LOC114366564 [Ostrinia furnacalis]|uniref:uncharacterized protein LOC114366564 n=1 Tax=Ostrinia furnacalis TaxID=93504 RepID=UPI00103B8C5C|nr:uncharacterized protein LOC114366564 [Ostrinia furnacalis]